MLTNIFSNLDPIWFNLCYKSTFIYTTIPLLVISTFWHKITPLATLTTPVTSYIYTQLKRTKLTSLKTISLIISSLFIFLAYINIIGILPYIFSITSHIILTISLRAPTWIILVTSRILFSPKKTIRHILPDSAPLWLNPFLIIIEFIRTTVRPLTLGFRLAANITAGHIILCLISSFSVANKARTFIAITAATILYIMFEIIICIIQAYIFCLLVSLYRNDHQ